MPLVRISPKEIAKKKRVPTNGQYLLYDLSIVYERARRFAPILVTTQKDYFDLIIIDECHRGGASDESSWRDILEYFSPAVQIGSDRNAQTQKTT